MRILGQSGCNRVRSKLRRIEDLRFGVRSVFLEGRVWVVCMLNRVPHGVESTEVHTEQSACCSRLLSNPLLCFTAVFVLVGFEV